MIHRIHAAIVLACTAIAQADDVPKWTQFLGPRGTAVVESRPASLSFDLETGVLWHVSLPCGSSSPCIWGDRLFLTAHEGDQLVMIALDRTSGVELWRRAVPSPKKVPVAHVDADPAAPTPCTDGERVVFYFGEYGLVTTDLSGNMLWQKQMPAPGAPFGIGTSPILVDDMVILSRDGCPDSGIYAFAMADGQQRWQVPRPAFTFSFGTPFVWHSAAGSGRRELVLGSTQRLVSFDPATGTELWRVNGLTDFICTTPTADTSTLYFAAWSTGAAEPSERMAASFVGVDLTPEELADGRKLFARLDTNGDGRILRDELPPSRAKDAFGFIDRDGDGVVAPEEFVPTVERPKGRGNNSVIAVSAGGAGDVTKSHVRWTYRRGLPYVSSPLLHEGRLYLVKTGGLITCLDPETGKPHFDRERLDDRSEYYASPVGVPGHVIVCASGGTIYVLKTADELEIVAQVNLGERITATPAIVDGTIYVRSETGLRAFGR